MHLLIIEEQSFEDWLASHTSECDQPDWDAIAALLSKDSEPFIRAEVPAKNPSLSDLIFKALEEDKKFSLNPHGKMERNSMEYCQEISACKVSNGQRFLNFSYSWEELDLFDGDVILVKREFHMKIRFYQGYSRSPAKNFKNYIRQTNRNFRSENSVMAIVHYDSPNVAAACDLRNGLANFNLRMQLDRVSLAVFSMETMKIEENHPAAASFPEKKRLLYDLMGYFNTAGSPGSLVLYASEPWLEAMEKVSGPVRNFILTFYFHSTGDRRFIDPSSLLVIPFDQSPMEILGLLASVPIPDQDRVNKHTLSAFQKITDGQHSADGSFQDAVFQQLLDKDISRKMPASRAGLTLSEYSGKPKYFELEYQAALGKILRRNNIQARYAVFRDLIGIHHPWFVQ